MIEFKKENLTVEDAFWVMKNFLQKHYELSNNTIEISDLLSFIEPMDWNGSEVKVPADSSMIEYWNEAFEKYKNEGKPDWKKIK